MRTSGGYTIAQYSTLNKVDSHCISMLRSGTKLEGLTHYYGSRPLGGMFIYREGGLETSCDRDAHRVVETKQ
jgi:hypothetical protein